MAQISLQVLMGTPMNDPDSIMGIEVKHTSEALSQQMISFHMFKEVQPVRDGIHF
jgi:hypothetical protein